MIPLLVLIVAAISARALGAIAVDDLDSWHAAARLGLAAMLVLTASAHFGSRRPDLIRMVPPSLPQPALLVILTGVAELALAVGLVIEPTAKPASLVLIGLLVAMFPANVHAARSGVGIGDRPPTPLMPRAVMQLLFIATAATVYIGGRS